MGKKLLEGLFATLVVFVVGIFGLSATFSDLGPGETWPIRIATVLAVCLVGSAGVGFLLRKWWPAAVACSWGFLLGGVYLSQSPHTYFQVALLFAPILCVLGGFAGYQLRKRYFEHKRDRG